MPGAGYPSGLLCPVQISLRHRVAKAQYGKLVIMRKALKKLDGKRLRFQATVERFGQKTNWHGYPESTILLKHVIQVDTGNLVADHLWFTVGKTLAALSLRPGETVEFDARVGDYEKGYRGRREDVFKPGGIDYKLNRPTRFERVTPDIQVPRESGGAPGLR